MCVLCMCVVAMFVLAPRAATHVDANDEHHLPAPRSRNAAAAPAHKHCKKRRAQSAERRTVAPHEHRVGLRVVGDRLAQAVGQLALARRVLDDRHDAVAVEAVALDALAVVFRVVSCVCLLCAFVVCVGEHMVMGRGAS